MKKCAARNKAAFVQKSVDPNEQRAFNAVQDCEICRAINNHQKVKHRPHHPRCPKNRKTTPENEQALPGNENVVNTALAIKQRQRMVENTVSTKSADGARTGQETNPQLLADNQQLVKTSPVELALFLESKAADRMKNIKTKSPMPPFLAALAEEVMEQVAHKKLKNGNETNKKKIARHNFQSIFGKNNMVYTIPEIMDASHQIHPHFHALAGSKFIMMDFDLAFPDLTLHCPNCNSSKLESQRNMWSTGNRLFPIVDDGIEVWCLPFKYKCADCPCSFSTKDGDFLNGLPAWIRNQYPVDPRYASSTTLKHLSKKLSSQLSEDMLSFSSAAQFVQKIQRRKHEKYLQRVEDYLSRPAISPEQNYPSLKDVVRTYPPTDQQCRDFFLDAEKSTLNPEGMSAKDRYERSIQSTTIDELGTADWTYSTLKNFNLPGAKVIFTMMNEKGQICNFAAVASEKSSEIDHLVRIR